MSAEELDFVHVFEPALSRAAPTLLLLHGTGGDERDLLPLGRALAPDASLLSPRGKIVERGMPRFFRRLAEGVFDLDDLRRRTQELGEFVHAAASRYAFDPHAVTAVGFSNGANIAASLLLLRPGLLAAALLFRAMVPLAPEPLPRLPGTPVLLAAGLRDPIIPPAEAERLAAVLRRAGAEVMLRWEAADHQLTASDVAAGREWLAGRLK